MAVKVKPGPYGSGGLLERNEMLEKCLMILLATPIAFAIGWAVLIFTQNYAAHVAAVDPVAAVAIVVVGLTTIATVAREFFKEVLK